MAKERLKNVGVTFDVWKELKIITIEKSCTMTEAIAELLKTYKQAQGQS